MVIDDNRVLVAVLRKDFCAFVQKTFYYLNPGERYRHNWHVEVIAHHLALCLTGKIKRLVILLPPRNLKSTIVSVAWPAFVLGHFPSTKFICASYSQELANKLSNDGRSIMNSDFYREIFPATVIGKDTQEHFDTTQHGGRFATSIGGVMTGFGGDIIVIDDPQKPVDMAHEGARHKARDWLFNTALSRFNDQNTGILVIVMQRLHEDDLVGNIENNPDYTILKIPARAEEDFVFDLDYDLAFQFKTGSYLQPDRFGQMLFDKQRLAMGSREFSAQYQQNPLPLEGGLLEWSWFGSCDELPKITELIMSVDVAGTDGGGHYTAITLWGHLEGKWYMIAAHRHQFNLADVRKMIQRLDQEYGPDLIVIESAGIGGGLISELKNKKYAHVEAMGASVSKLRRANDVVAMIEAGRVFILSDAPGIPEFRNEIVAFPNGRSDDLLDSMTQVLRHRATILQRARMHKREERRGLKSEARIPTLTAINIPSRRRLVRFD